jgi:hypothetical protein
MSSGSSRHRRSPILVRHTLTRGEEQGPLLSLATTVARHQPKVSKTSSPCRPDAVGEDLIVFSGPKHR